MEKTTVEKEIPVFSGRPEDMDSFVADILEDMSIKELSCYAVQNFVKDGIVTGKGYVLLLQREEAGTAYAVFIRISP